MANGDSAFKTVSGAQANFQDESPDATVKCQAGGSEKPKPPSPCAAEQIKKNLASCDGDTGQWNEAKKAIGKEPTLKVAAPSSGFDAETNISTGTITIKPTNCCDATASLFFELSNVRNTNEFNKVDGEAAKGELGREEYTKASEKIEYEGVILLRDTFKKCKKAWSCGDGATSGYESVSNNFDDYYNTQLVNSHKNHYRRAWDNAYKSAYEAKHKK